MFADFEGIKKQRDTSIVMISQSARCQRVRTDTKYRQLTYNVQFYI